MYLESFRHIIEIEALKKLNNENLKHISSENKRISDLFERRKVSAQQIENLKQDIHSLKLKEIQLNVELLSAREKKLQSQLGLAVTEKEQLAFEAQANITKKERETYEDDYFLKLEKQESYESEIENLNSFLKGSEATLLEIQREAQELIAAEERTIDGRNLRIKSLFELLHPSARTLYGECEKRSAGKKTIAFLIDRKCSECHMLLDYNLKAGLEHGQSLETCTHCGRFLVPDSARIY